METTIKSSILQKKDNSGSIVLIYKKHSLILGLLSLLSILIVLPLCFLLVGLVLLPIPIILIILFYVIQLNSHFKIKENEGIILKKHQIAFKDISDFKIHTFRGVSSLLATVHGKDIVIANLLRPTTANELLSIISK